jgi:pyruvate formate lyase activating enzyme
VLKDLTYYQKSGGGVTFSGGEPTLQSGFLIQAISGLKEISIHTALDTCGLCAYQVLEETFPLIDLILFDIKTINPLIHNQYTGHTNERILGNLKKLLAYLKIFPSDFELWIRSPLIPGSTATKENLEAIARFLIENGLNQISRWELCAFNNLCNDKYLRLDQKWTYENYPLMTKKQLDQCRKWVIDSGFPIEKVFVTGASRVEKAIEGAII